MPNSFASAFPKCEVNLGSRSEIIRVGSPNHRYTFSRYSWAIWGPVMVVWHGRNNAPLEHPWLTMVRMASKPLLFGSPVIRSIAIYWKGLASGGTGIR